MHVTLQDNGIRRHLFFPSGHVPHQLKVFPNCISMSGTTYLRLRYGSLKFNFVTAQIKLIQLQKLVLIWLLVVS